MIKSTAHSPQYIVFLFSILFVITSCQHNRYRDAVKNPSPYFTHFFTGSEENVLRDVNFNSTQDELKKTEKSRLFESTADHLFYEFSYPTDSTAFSEYANVQYFFNEDNQLDIITADIFLNDSLQENQLKNNLNEYYNLRFGSPETDDYDHNVWKGSFKDAKSDKKYNYTVALKELTGDYGITVEYVRE